MILQRYHELSLRYNGNDANAYVVESAYSVLGVFSTEARATTFFDTLKQRMIQFAQPRKLEGGWTLTYRVYDESVAFPGRPFRLSHPKHGFNVYGTEVEALRAHKRFLQRLNPTRVAVVEPPAPESAPWSWWHVIGFVIAACGLALIGVNL